VVVNAGNVEKDFQWLQSQQPGETLLKNRSDDYALMALQGPRAAAILQPLTQVDLSALKYYHFVEGDLDGQPAVVARTGYTGEDGFEIFLAPDQAAAGWKRLLEAGGPQGLVPAGLGARDTLRLEARMCLYGMDMDETTTLVEAGLGWIVALTPTKGEFPGRAVLEAQKKSGPPRKLVGFEVVGRGIARHGYTVLFNHQPVGAVTSGTYAPFLQKNIGLCYVPAAHAAVGTDLEIDVRGRPVSARVVPTPFYKRAQ
jgi:glycine cleavage system T protein (aminomethyltransferase)